MAESAAMQPTRNPQVTLPDLLEVLLNKGVHLDLDLIISVADVPLIGVNLRATIAGIETMIEYGMMREWDEQTRAWVQRSLAAHLPMSPGEEVIARMSGGHLEDSSSPTWRPGTVYLTDTRLIVHRREPQETLWETRLEDIDTIHSAMEPSAGGERRPRIIVRLRDGGEFRITAGEPDRLITLVVEHLGRPASPDPDEEPADAPLGQGHMWYLETLSSGSVWRGGEATLSEKDGFVWKSPMDRRALVRLQPSEVTTFDTEQHDNPTDRPDVLILQTDHGSVRLAVENLSKWTESFTSWKEAHQGAR